MGTMLQSLGIPSGVNPAEFCMERMDIVRQVHTAYIEAGADIVLTATFGGTSFKLPSSIDPTAFNKAMAENTKQVTKELSQKLNRPLFVAGDIGPVGHFLKPLGDLAPETFIEAIRAQVRGLVAGGVDLIFIETQFDLAELRAAIAAVRMESDLPVFVSMTFEGGVNLTGTTPEIYAATMQNIGVDAIGVNCGAGPEQLLSVVQKILASCTLPVFAKPNAGLPELIDGETVFRLSPEDFSEKTELIARAGATILGGCCGTNPEHIRMLRERVLAAYEEKFTAPARSLPNGARITSRSKIVHVGRDFPSVLIGNRINAQNDASLKAELEADNFDLAEEYASDQVDLGAHILGVNAVLDNVDEAKLLPSLLETLLTYNSIPFCLNFSSTEALIATIPWYTGSALLNPISADASNADSLEKITAQSKLWGAPLILPLSIGSQMPQSAKERIQVIEKALKDVQKYNMPNHLIIIDTLAFTDRHEPKICNETEEWCHEHNLASTFTFSNISSETPTKG